MREYRTTWGLNMKTREPLVGLNRSHQFVGSPFDGPCRAFFVVQISLELKVFTSICLIYFKLGREPAHLRFVKSEPALELRQHGTRSSLHLFLRVPNTGRRLF